MDQSVRLATTAEVLERELKFAPTIMLTENGFEPITEKPQKPSAVMVALMDEPPPLFTGLVWAEMAIAAKVDIALEIGSPIEALQDADILSSIPEDTLLYLAGWQQMVNNGSCWNTAGSIGRTAHELIDDGFLLLGKTAQAGAYGNTIPGRDDVRPGSHGSARFVQAMMGMAYYTWVNALD